MKAEKIYYKRLFNLGSYQNIEVGITLIAEEGDKAIDVFEKAKLFVDSLDPNDSNLEEYNQSKLILERPDNYNYAAVKRAEMVVLKWENENSPLEDLPF